MPVEHLPVGSPVEIFDSRRNRLIWRSHPGPQTGIFSVKADIVAAGGSKGGGKSDLAIFWAAGLHTWDGPQYFQVGRYKAVIFRRSFPELQRNIIERSLPYLGEWWKYTDRTHTWRTKTPDGGEATIEFAYIERPSDVFKYSGTEYTRIVVDESNLHGEQEIRTLLGCNRTSIPGLKPQMLLLPNPLGPGFGWHKLLFIKDKVPFQVYTDARWPSDRKLLGLSTVYLPFRLRENPSLMKNDPGYIDRLRTQYGKMADALIEGSWEEGTHIAFDQYYETTHCVPAFDEQKRFVVPYWAETWLSTDWGGTGKKAKDMASTVFMAADNRRVYAVWDHTRKGRDIVPYAHEILERVRQSDKVRRPTFMVLSHECFADKGMGNTQADQFSKVMTEGGITVIPGGRDPQGRLTLTREFLRVMPLPQPGIGHSLQDVEFWAEKMRTGGEEGGNEYLRAVGILRNEEVLPKLLLLMETPDGVYGCPDLMRNLPLLTTDIENPLVLAEGQDDDSADALGQALRAFVMGPSRPVEEIYAERTGGKMPETTVQMELGMAAAQREWEKEEGQSSAPVRWPMKRFE